MRAFHICNINSQSGIAKYASDFHDMVLGPLGYELISPCNVLSDWIAQQPADTRWHIQLGAMQFEERKAFTRLYYAGAKQVDATLHDPPFLTFPYFPFSSSFLTKLSRGFDWYLGSFGFQQRALRRLNKVFVLTEKGRFATERMRGNDVYRIPHIVHPNSIWQTATSLNNDILYFGFIGQSKGIDYALMLHERILRLMPEVNMHVVGKTTSNTQHAFLQSLKKRFHRKVTYHGFIAEDSLDELFSRVRHVFLPFQPYKHFYPASGSVINGLKRGRIVWSTPVNSVPELIINGKNGLLLTGNLEADADMFFKLSCDQAKQDQIAHAALETARGMSAYPYAQHFL